MQPDAVIRGESYTRLDGTQAVTRTVVMRILGARLPPTNSRSNRDPGCRSFVPVSRLRSSKSRSRAVPFRHGNGHGADRVGSTCDEIAVRSTRSKMQSDSYECRGESIHSREIVNAPYVSREIRELPIPPKRSPLLEGVHTGGTQSR